MSHIIKSRFFINLFLKHQAFSPRGCTFIHSLVVEVLTVWSCLHQFPFNMRMSKHIWKLCAAIGAPSQQKSWPMEVFDAIWKTSSGGFPNPPKHVFGAHWGWELVHFLFLLTAAMQSVTVPLASSHIVFFSTSSAKNWNVFSLQHKDCISSGA